MTSVSLDDLCVNTIRTLTMDAVQAANSGHPGAPMALAPLCYVLWTRHLRHNPADPEWIGRDRFVLSCGHASMLMYSLLHLTGYDVSLDDIKQFRQLGSKTPGHPECGVTPGVETTTGPLGQGVGNAVGMALAATHLGAVFNRPGHEVVSQRTYFLASDGDLMEGVSHEAASLAGHLELGSLIGFFDDNRITIDGATDLTVSDDPVGRFEAYGWHVTTVEDGNDLEALDRAIAVAQEDPRPSLIIVRTHIAYGSPNKQDTAASHGAALGEEEVALTKENLGWPETEPFAVPAEALTEWRKCMERGADLQTEWQEGFAAYQAAFPEEAAELRRRVAGSLPEDWESVLRRVAGSLPEDWESVLPTFASGGGAMATRKASGAVLNALGGVLPELMGGSADLTGSVMTKLEEAADFGAQDYTGRNLYFGVREHAMAAVMNGTALHGGVRPYGGTFLIFADYMKPAIRLAAMMGQCPIYLFSHDSIGLGEDGPTHQPVETLTALRSIPNLWVIRPADANDVVEAWREAIKRQDGPTAIVLTRQGVPVLDRSHLGAAAGLARGGYVLAEASGGSPDVVLMASGSEVSVVLAAREALEQQGTATRVVNLPCLETFAEQPDRYRDEILPPGLPKVAVEAGHPMSWYRWVGDRGAVMGIEGFGASAPSKDLFVHFGLTPERVVERAQALLGG
jgi:transketolase